MYEIKEGRFDEFWRKKFTQNQILQSPSASTYLKDMFKAALCEYVNGRESRLSD